jgi:hypothetical protein
MAGLFFTVFFVYILQSTRDRQKPSNTKIRLSLIISSKIVMVRNRLIRCVSAISTEGTNLMSSVQGDFSRPFEMTAIFLALAINLLKTDGRHKPQCTVTKRSTAGLTVF